MYLESSKSRILAGLKFNEVYFIKIFKTWEFLGGPVVRTWAFTAVAPGSIPGWGTKITEAVRPGQKKRKKNFKRFV